MTWRTIALVVAGVAALACFVVAWIAHERRAARQFDRLARTYGIKRQPGEARREFRERVMRRVSLYWHASEYRNGRL